MRLLLTFLSSKLADGLGSLLASKFFQSVSLGLLLTPLVAIVEKYLFNDWQFLRFLCVLVALDTVLGVHRQWTAHAISSRGFSRLFKKSFIYLVLLVLTHVLTSFPIQDVPNDAFKWVDVVMFSCMMAREALSILEHLALIEPRLVPKPLLKRLALVAEDGPENVLPTATPPATIQPAEGLIQ